MSGQAAFAVAVVVFLLGMCFELLRQIRDELRDIHAQMTSVEQGETDA